MFKTKKKTEKKEEQTYCLHFTAETGDIQFSRAFLARLSIRGTCLGSRSTDEDFRVPQLREFPRNCGKVFFRMHYNWKKENSQTAIE